MRKQAIDLFDDPPWPTEVQHDGRAIDAPRPFLAASLVLVVVLLASTALPWFSSSESPPLTPYSYDLSRGGGMSPGTQFWGVLVLALGIVTAVSIGAALVVPCARRTYYSLGAATVLALAVLLQLTAHPTINPGPTLGSTYGAWIGAAAAVFAWCAAAAASLVALVLRL